MEEVRRLLQTIQRTAEIIHEHLEATSSRDHILTLGIEGIMNTAKEALEAIHKLKL